MLRQKWPDPQCAVRHSSISRQCDNQIDTPQPTIAGTLRRQQIASRTGRAVGTAGAGTALGARAGAVAVMAGVATRSVDAVLTHDTRVVRSALVNVLAAIRITGTVAGLALLLASTLEQRLMLGRCVWDVCVWVHVCVCFVEGEIDRWRQKTERQRDIEMSAYPSAVGTVRANTRGAGRVALAALKRRRVIHSAALRSKVAWMSGTVCMQAAWWCYSGCSTQFNTVGITLCMCVCGEREGESWKYIHDVKVSDVNATFMTNTFRSTRTHTRNQIRPVRSFQLPNLRSKCRLDEAIIAGYSATQCALTILALLARLARVATVTGALAIALQRIKYKFTTAGEER